MNTLLLVDGTNLATRAWYTGNLYGLWNMLLTTISEIEVTHLAIVFDNGQESWRHLLYPDYKATRREKPAGLLPYLRAIQVALASEIQCFAFPEADDGLASLARQAGGSAVLRGQAFRTVILSGDKDLLQLVDTSRRVEVLLFGRHFSDRHLVTGDDPRFLDWVTLVGDKSDNLPGVRGIGPKMADRLLERFGSLQAIYAHLDEIAPGQVRKLEAGREAAFLTGTLVRLDFFLDVGFGWCEWLEKSLYEEAALRRSVVTFRRLWNQGGEREREGDNDLPF